MKKIVVVSSLAIVIAGGAAAVPYYSGDKVESSINTVQTLRRGAVSLSYEANSYERGYLNSSADSTLAVSVADEVVRFAVEHEIEHMLVPQVRSTFRVLPEGDGVQRALYEFFGDQPVLITDTRMTTGGATVAATMPEVQGMLADELTRLSFGGLNGNFIYGGDKLAGTIDVQPLSMFEGEMGLVIGAQQLQFENREVSELVSPGEASYSLERFEWRDADGVIALDKVRVTSSQSVNADLIGSEMLMEVASLETPKGHIDDLSLSMGLDNFHRDLMEFLAEMEQNAPEDLENFNIAPEVFEPMLVRFLESAPGYDMQFVLGPSTDSRMALNWDMLYSKPEALEIDLDQPMSLIAGIDTTVLLTFKPEFINEVAELTGGVFGSAEEINAMLGMMEAEGYLSRDDKGYRVKLGFQGGNLTVNDVPRPELMMMLAMLAME